MECNWTFRKWNETIFNCIALIFRKEDFSKAMLFLLTRLHLSKRDGKMGTACFLHCTCTPKVKKCMGETRVRVIRNKFYDRQKERKKTVGTERKYHTCNNRSRTKNLRYLIKNSWTQVWAIVVFWFIWIVWSLLSKYSTLLRNLLIPYPLQVR